MSLNRLLFQSRLTAPKNSRLLLPMVPGQLVNGALPPGWGMDVSGTTEKIVYGWYKGVPYIDISYVGTPSAGTQQIYLDNNTNPAAAGDTYQVGAYTALYGSLTNLTGVQWILNVGNPGYLATIAYANSTTPVNFGVQIKDALLMSPSQAVAPSGTTVSQTILQINWNLAAVNVTFRLMLPRLLKL